MHSNKTYLIHINKATQCNRVAFLFINHLKLYIHIILLVATFFNAQNLLGQETNKKHTIYLNGGISLPSNKFGTVISPQTSPMAEDLQLGKYRNGAYVNFGLLFHLKSAKLFNLFPIGINTNFISIKSNSSETIQNYPLTYISSGRTYNITQKNTMQHHCFSTGIGPTLSYSLMKDLALSIISSLDFSYSVYYSNEKKHFESYTDQNQYYNYNLSSIQIKPSFSLLANYSFIGVGCNFSLPFTSYKSFIDSKGTNEIDKHKINTATLSIFLSMLIK